MDRHVGVGEDVVLVDFQRPGEFALRPGYIAHHLFEGLRVPGSGSRVSNSRFRASGFRFQFSDFVLHFSFFGFRVSVFSFRVSGFGFWFSGLGFRVLNSGCTSKWKVPNGTSSDHSITHVASFLNLLLLLH